MDTGGCGTNVEQKRGGESDSLHPPAFSVQLVWLLILFLCLTLTACTRPKPLLITPSVAPDLSEFHQGLAALYEFTPDGYARAIGHFQRASELSPGDCEYRLHLAEANLFLALEQKLNTEDFRPALERGTDPQCAPGSAFTLRLDAFRSLDDFGPSRDRTGLGKIDQAIGMEPENPFNWFVRWKMNPTTRQQENSILKAAEIAPELAMVQYELGNYWLVKADYPKARQAFDRALELSPRHFRSLIGLAQALSAIDENEDVEPLYKRAVELAPDFLEGRILLGDYYSSLEENELAREHYLAVVKRSPRFEVAHLRLGLNYLQTLEFDPAERAFHNAIEINPASYEAHYYLGNIWFARGNLEMARGEYEEALKFVLNFPEAVYALGTVFFREGKTDSALEQFEKVLRMNRTNADAYFSRAGIRAQHRQFSDAIDDYNRAIELYDNQLLSIGKSIGHYEDRGLTRKVEAERKREERLEGIVERARQLKMKAEDESLGPR
jgi:tetratricopeptide (TPR) repeat protein